MARKPRENVEGGIFHVYARGANRLPVFVDRRDRETYLRTLGNVVERLRWFVLSYCLMNNHVHLLVETPDANLSRGMQRLQGQYAQTFNSRHARSGHVFQGRYGAVLIENDRQLAAVASYIAHNPIEAGLCKHLGEWEWSSHRGMQGSPVPAWLATDRLLSFFDDDIVAARRRFLFLCKSYESAPKGA